MYEEFAEDALSSLEDSFLQDISVSGSSSGTMVLESELDIDSAIDKSNIEEKAQSKVEHVAELNGVDIEPDGPEVESAQRAAVESSKKIMEDRIEKISKAQIDAVEQNMEKLDNKMHKDIAKNSSDRFQEFLGEVYKDDISVHDKLKDMSSEEQSKNMEEMKEHGLLA
jgi:predicted RND superfamily exporter protein